jgi:hypothetical protein
LSATRLIVCTVVGGARGVGAAASAVAVAATPIEPGRRGSVVLDLRSRAQTPRGPLLATPAARGLESAIGQDPQLRSAARGRLCFATPAEETQPADLLGRMVGADLGAGLVVCLCDPDEFRGLLAAGEARPAALLRAPSRSSGPLIALLASELRSEGVPLKVWRRPIGLIAARRATAGIESGGESGRIAARLAGGLAPRPAAPGPPSVRAVLGAEGAQALPAVLAVAILVVAVSLILLAVGGAATAKGRLQRSTDLAALSAARSMRDDFDRLFVPALRVDGTLNPDHLDRAAYLGRARSAALEAAERNGLNGDLVEVRFPDGGSFAPLRVRAVARVEVGIAGGPRSDSGSATRTTAEAEVSPPTAPVTSTRPASAAGGGYGGVLAYRQAEGMRPDVAIAFDRMARAAAADGVDLVINSAYRSDAEQQRLLEQNPDPRMVAPPGTSLHRCGTELDLGPPAAYGWLAANARRFGFLARYPWEAWHFGYVDGPEPCSAEGDVAGSERADGRTGGGEGLPGFVPDRYRRMLLGAAARHGVSAALLAAQIMAESNFNPAAVSPAGALGIAQFMPATAAAYGLDDPFDAEAAIEAQARMMGELLGRFGSIELALAAYNAGPGAVEACGCVPFYPETQAYVARILGLLGGAGALGVPAPELEVRLVA